MLNCLAAAIPGGDRVVSAEEVFELRFPHPDRVAMQTRQAGLEGTCEIRLPELVKVSLRMPPSRIIVGGVTQCREVLARRASCRRILVIVRSSSMIGRSMLDRSTQDIGRT